MSNKETLQSYNTRLNNNNINLDTILETINNLPEAGIGELNLQDKTIEITENGTTNIVADEGYDGLNTLKVTTNVPTSGGEPTVEPDYITDGLIAWFDGENELDENNRWNSRVGDDYISSLAQKLGNATSNPIIFSKGDKELINNFVYALGTSIDYYNEGYTFEVVGRVTSKNNANGATGGWLLASNNQNAFGIGVTGENGEIRFANNSSISKEKTYTGYYNKKFGASVYTKTLGVRDSSSAKYNLLCSANGEAWFSVAETKNLNKMNSTNNANKFAVLCYYIESGNPNASYSINGGVNCIRIYNRQLTNEELAYNHSIDKARFNLDE